MARVQAMPVEIYASNPVGNSTKFEGPDVVSPVYSLQSN